MSRPLADETVECAIARHWPDVGAIALRTKASRARIAAVHEYLERLERAPRREHDCATHVRGSEGCYVEHLCRCQDCMNVHHALALPIVEPETARLRAAHAAYRRGDRTPEVVAGEREYQNNRPRRSKRS